jgi:cell division protein FtsQ
MKAAIATLDRALGRLMRPLVNLVPRRLRRAADRMERQRTRPIGQMAAIGFLLASVLYGLTVGGQLGRVGDAALVLVGFGIDDVRISGRTETAELAILEKLEISGSLLSFDVQAAQARLATLPWAAKATVRKYYPSTLSVEIEERQAYALWQKRGTVFVVDKSGTEIVELEESRFGKLPFTVGKGANLKAAEFLDTVLAEPEIAGQMRAAVFVAGRRWDLHLENGVTVKLPEKDVSAALTQLVKLSAERQLLSRDVIVVDLRLPDRVTVRLPEGRTLEDVTTEGGETPVKIAKART